MYEDIERYWGDLEALAAAVPHRLIGRAAELLMECYRAEGTVVIAGNGGSAATASHLACDLAKGTLCAGVRPFRVVPLTDNVPLLTAWANDTTYERVFAEQVAALIRAGDVLIAISASGSSPNVLAAARVARQYGASVIALTGRSGGRVQRLANLTIRMPSDQMELVEDAHLAAAHSLCVALRGQLQQATGLEAEERPVAAAVVLDVAL